jgi:hypothetical protein
MPEGNCHMKTTAAFASLTAATGSVAVSTQDSTPLLVVLVLVGLRLVGHGAFLVLYVCRPADRKDLRKYLRARRER